MVFVIGTIMAIWAFALYQMVIPAFQEAAGSGYGMKLRGGAEAALDWYVNRLPADSTLDDATCDSEAVTITVPANVLPHGVNATIQCRNVEAPTQTYLYDQYADAATPATNLWRQVTATCTEGLFSWRVQVTLKPEVAVTTTTSTTTGMMNGFQQGLFGITSIEMTGNEGTDSIDTTIGTSSRTQLNGDVVSLGSITLGANSDIGGNVVAYHPNSGNVDETSTSQNITGGKHINGIVRSWGDTSISSASVTNAASDPAGALQVRTANPPPPIPATPAAPGTATNLGSVSLADKSTMTLSAGDYIMNSLAISGKGELIINASNGPVNIWIQGSPGTVDIQGNGITNTGGRARNLRIWYGGTNEMKIAGNGNFTGVIFAPNAQVKFAGNGHPTGAVVGNVIVGNGGGAAGGFTYDRDLMNNPIQIPVNTTTTSNVAQTNRNWKTVSWREI